MTIAFRSVNTSSSLSTNHMTLNLPSGVVSGDILLAFFCIQTTSLASVPSGWTQVDQGGFGANYVHVYKKTAGGSEPSTYTFNGVGTYGSNSGGCIAAYANADSVGASSFGSSTNSSSVTASSVTTTYANEMVVFCGVIQTGASFTPPSGMTERADFTVGTRGMEMAELLVASPGATGSKVATASSSANNNAILVRILPPAPAIVRNRALMASM